MVSSNDIPPPDSTQPNDQAQNTTFANTQSLNQSPPRYATSTTDPTLQSNDSIAVIQYPQLNQTISTFSDPQPLDYKLLINPPTIIFQLHSTISKPVLYGKSYHPVLQRHLTPTEFEVIVIRIETTAKIGYKQKDILYVAIFSASLLLGLMVILVTEAVYIPVEYLLTIVLAGCMLCPYVTLVGIKWFKNRRMEAAFEKLFKEIGKDGRIVWKLEKSKDDETNMAGLYIVSIKVDQLHPY